ncbi:MAG: branched-chain amino acid ABC transporter permease [Pusillimonas sp.]|nr:branched-chain amino acid ABC transporter permease [Pusillimonas sp.]MBC43987.1 branched-chain amino acid ABC transporter permease [Pusillimonas sp.]HCP78418.1 branched-chain amino acid ABC transporter permease [Pusillimonas sp.]|tara:strand:- start:82911 stop:83954 length:1044 start_codon:yes stop_codon:yes gene_type:complete
MDSTIAMILLADGLAWSAIYLIIGLGLVLIFSVTRVIFVPFGSVAVFSALSLGAMELGRLPAMINLIGLFVALALLMELVELWRQKAWHRLPRTLLVWLVAPLVPCALAFWATGQDSEALRVLTAILLAVPLGPLIERVALRPIAQSSVLSLLIVSLVLDLVLAGLGLLWFGPEGIRTKAAINGSIAISPNLILNYQTLLTIGVALALALLFYIVLQRTRMGKVLHATASNPIGARLVGIRPAVTATVAHAIAALLAGIVGVLVSPVATIYYDSGLILTLKAFVAAIIGGMVSYPLTALGALLIGVSESFAAFWNSGLKDAIVFGLLIPILVIRSSLTAHQEEESEE